MKKITRQYWDIIPIPDIVIDQVKILGKEQQELLVFTDCKVRIIGDGDAELTGVYGDGYEQETPLKIENENDLEYQDYQKEVHPDQEDQTII